MNRLIDELNESSIPVFDTLYKLLKFIFDILGPLIELIGEGLAPVLELVVTILKPILFILEMIFKLVNLIIDGFAKMIGYGKLWGIDEETTNSNNNNDNASPKYPNSSDLNVNDILKDMGLPSDYSSGLNSSSYSDYTNNYVDNSNIVINIEKNEYLSEDDIIRAVNKGLKQAKQSRT
jgi:hypothetical protein